MSIDTVLKEVYTHLTHFHEILNIKGFLIVVPEVLSEEECKRVISIGEEKGFVPASFFTDKDGVEHYSDIRKSGRCIIDSKEFAQALWKRVKWFIPENLFPGWEVVGLNERLRFLKYNKGDEFKPHSDGSYTSPEGNVSKLTLLLYLNTDYDNGYTNFLNEQGEWVPIVPEVGMVAIQDQVLIHCVPPIKNGIKYAIRTEVMYKFIHSNSQTKIISIY
jgi:prolyl 4-hydroxylase